MSDKRFERWNDHSCKVKDNQEDTLLNWEDVVDKLNEQQSIIRRDEMSIKTMMSNMKKLEEEKVELMEDCACQYKQIQKLESENEDLREVNKETVKQCERWKNLYELKDAEVTARVDALNKVCEYYTSEVLFKSDVDPNKAVKEVINEILNAPIYEEGLREWYED